MNYLRHDGAYVSLKTIDKDKNAKDYLDFKVMQGKTEEEAKEALNKLAIKDYLAIIENDTNKFVGTIGFDSIVQTNQRANISFDFSEEVNGNKAKKILYGQKAINAMTRYAFESLNLRNVLAEIPANDEVAVELFRDLDLYDYIGTRNFSKKVGDELYGTHMFEVVPDTNEEHLLLPENKVLVCNQERIVDLGKMKMVLNGSSFKLIDPENYEEGETDYLQERFGKSLNEQNLATDIGFYKTTFNDYRLSKKFKGPNRYDYLIVHNDGKVIGYVEKLHNDPSNLATDIDVAIIDNDYKNMGIESEALKIYSDELRRIGYVSISSIGFKFNGYSDDSLSIRSKAGFKEYAKRTKAYFGFGRLHDMIYFEKPFDDDIGKSFIKK